jgi:hypothetical protein
MNDRPYTHKIGNTCIICGCLSIITGLILIVIGITSQARRTIFIGIGIIILGAAFFLTTLVCVYGKLNIHYNNWAYRSRVLPTNVETPRPVPPDIVSCSSFIEPSAGSPRRQLSVPLEIQRPIAVISDVEIHRVVTSPSIRIGTTTTNIPEIVT